MDTIDMSTIDSQSLLMIHADILEELRQRGVIRSNNNPVADYAESLVAQVLGLTIAKASNKGFDAADDDGLTYEIKARRITKHNRSRMLSAIRQLDNKHFDYLVGVLFNANFSVKRACVMPYEVVKNIASYRKHTNAWNVRLEDTVWALDGVRDLTNELEQIAAAAGDVAS